MGRPHRGNRFRPAQRCSGLSYLVIFVLLVEWRLLCRGHCLRANQTRSLEIHLRMWVCHVVDEPCHVVCPPQPRTLRI